MAKCISCGARLINSQCGGVCTNPRCVTNQPRTVR